MSFLDRAKQTANKAINNNENKGGSPMTNPFIKNNVTNNTVNTSKPAINVPGAKPAVPGAKPSIKPPVGKPPVGGMKPPVAKPPVAPTAKPVVAPAVKPQEPVAEQEVKEEVVTPQEPVAVEEVKVEAKVETVEAHPEVTVTVEEEAQEPVKEEKKEEAKAEKKADDEYTEEELAAMSPQKRAAITRKKNQEAKKKAETKANAQTAIKEHKETVITTTVSEPVYIPETELNFADCVTAIKSNFVDQEWEEFRAKITTTMSEIVISNEMNKPQLHDLLSQIAILRDEISIVYNDTKTLYEGLTAKEDGLIDRTKRLNAKGTNAEERKVSGTIAVMNYKSKEGHNINLFELLDETRARYNFLRTINESIEFKKAVLLTMLSSLKSEK